MDLVSTLLFDEELDSFIKDTERLWDRITVQSSFIRKFTESWIPSVDILEREDLIIIKVELAGIDEKDVDVKITRNLINIKGKRRKEDKEVNSHYFYDEIYCGSFRRLCVLPTNVEYDKADTTYKRGILRIEIPKSKKNNQTV